MTCEGGRYLFGVARVSAHDPQERVLTPDLLRRAPEGRNAMGTGQREVDNLCSRMAATTED
jgi:hypothetical protein